LAIILDWMWTEALPLAQPTADAGGYGDAWRDMCCGRNEELARKAAEAAARVASCFDEPLRLVATWAGNSARAGSAARAAAWAAEGVAQAAARAAVRAARAEEAWAEREEAWENCWETLNPCGLLKRLIET